MNSQETLLETLLAKPLEVVAAMTDKELEEYFSSVLVITRPVKVDKPKKLSGSKGSTEAVGTFTEQQKALLEKVLGKTIFKT